MRMGRVETLTVLFTDLVDSTRRRVSVGEERADKLRLVHDRLVISAIQAAGGRVVKHTGDGFLATFGGASEGVAAAVAIQQALDAHNRREPAADLRVRIGLSAGDVSIDGGDCFGLPVIEAQRLENAAAPGQILCPSLLRSLTRGRGDHAFRPVGSLQLKGLAEQLDVEEVVWTPTPTHDDADPRLPPVLTQLGGFGFAGRDAECDSIAREWERAKHGATRVVLVTGEPGIGKTRLLAECAHRAVADGAVVLGGRCDELIGAPYQPFAEALRAQLRVEGAGAELGPLANELSRLVPDVQRLVPGLDPPLSADPDAERHKLFDAVRAWLTAAASRGLVLVLDDLHWADLSTLVLFRHVVLTDPVPSLLVLGTYRDTEIGRSHPLAAMLADLRRSVDVNRTKLEGLDEVEVAELVAAASGRELDPAGHSLARALQAETAGNPFFVSEVLRHLDDSGALDWDDSTARSESPAFGLPEGVREVVGRRLGALPTETQEALAAAAVVGADFALDVVASAAEQDEDTTLRALEPAVRANLVIETGVGQYRFAHALVRSTLHHELSSTRRARMHRRAAVTLEARTRDHLTAKTAGELAHHWSEASSGGGRRDEALHYSRRAAELARAAAAPAEAARWYRHALDVIDQDAEPRATSELLTRLGEVEYEAGLPGSRDSRLRAARIAESMGDVELMAAALSFSQRRSFDEAQPADLELMTMIDRALELVPRSDVLLRAELTGVLAIEAIFTGEIARRARLCAELEALIPQVDDFETRMMLRICVGRARPFSLNTAQLAQEELHNGDFDAGWTSDNVMFRVETTIGMTFLALCAGDRAFLDRAVDRARELRASGHPSAEDAAVLIETASLLVDARLDDAERGVEEVKRIWVAHNVPETDTYCDGLHYQIARERGLMDYVADMVMASAAELETDGKPRVRSALAALALAESGRLEDAAMLLDERGARGFVDIPDDAAMGITLAAWAETAARVRHQPAAEALYGLLSRDPHLHLGSIGWYLGASAHYLALLADSLGRPEAAASWFAMALQDHEAFCAPAWIARTLVEWAAHEHAAGDDARAADLAQRAMEVIGALPLDATRTRAEAMLRP